MTQSNETPPTVHQAMNAVMREITHLSKDSENKHFKFKFRGIDALLGSIAEPLRKHGVFIAPRLKSVSSNPIGNQLRTVVEMEYTVYGPAGDSFTVSFPGEAADQGDKSVGKATSYAFKMMAFQLFAIPVDGDSLDDPDAVSPQLDHGAAPARRTPQQIAEEALKATTVQHITRLANEAGEAGRAAEIRDPEGVREPISLGQLLLNLKGNMQAAGRDAA